MEAENKKPENKMRTAEELFGVKFIYNPELDKTSKMNLFPESLRRANELLKQVKFRYINIK